MSPKSTYRQADPTGTHYPPTRETDWTAVDQRTGQTIGVYRAQMAYAARVQAALAASVPLEFVRVTVTGGVT